MGHGSATVEFPIGPEIIGETANIAIVRAPEQEGHIGLLFYAEGHTPIDAQLAFPGALLPAPPPHDERIDINVPLVPGVAGGPYVAVIALQASIGPRGLTYYERVRGKLIAYHPQGVLLPDKCPRGGFVFAATLTFLDGSAADAKAAVPCRRTS